MRRTKYFCIPAVCLCLILAAMPVLARTYPYTDREPPFEGSVLMAANLKAIASADDETRFQDTGLSAFGDGSQASIDPDNLTGGTSERACGSLLHTRHSVDDFPGIVTETGLPKAPAAGGSYKVGDTKEIYNDLYNHDDTGAFTAEVVYVGDKCTLWRDVAHPDELPPGIQTQRYGNSLDDTIEKVYEILGVPSSVDVDGDGKLAIVFSSMESAKCYFSDADLFSKSEVSWANGNQMDMLHMKSPRSYLEFLDFLPSVAHELGHLTIFSRTLGTSDLWLEEVVVLNATIFADTIDTQNIPANALIDTINSTGISVPFIGDGNYVPSGTAPYGQWYLFACYLTAQTQFLPGGGNAICQTILDTLTWSENGFTAGSCTKDALVQALTDMYYMGEDTGGAKDFEELILNYNTALFLRDGEGIYSMNNFNNPEMADLVGAITLDKITPFTGTAEQLPGGGAACWLSSPGSVTPKAHGADIRYAGIYTDPLVVPAAVQSSVPAGEVEPGTMVSLSCTTQGASIYYTTDENNLTMENGILYTEPIAINTDTYLRAWAVSDYVTEKVTSSETTFRYQISGPKGDRYEANNDFSSATSVSFPGKYEATLHMAEDKDYYTFKLEHPATLNLTLTSPAKTSYGLSLYRENNLPEKEKVKTSRLSKGTQSIRQKAEAGTYYVEVFCPEGSSGSDKEDYVLDLQRQCDNGENLGGLNLSEIHMVNALADKKNSPLAYDYDVLLDGGNYLKSSAYLTSWAGPVSEEGEEFSYPDAALQNNYTPVYKESDSLYHVQNILYLPNSDRENFIQHLKNAVYSYGAAEIYVYSAKNYQAENGTYWYVDKQVYDYETPGYDGPHIVTVVGWDDSISREKFKGSGDESTPLPGKDGALIVRNSWGEDSGDGGYFYLSYEDAYITTNYPAVYIADESPDNYNHQYFNDTKGGCASVNYGGSKSLAVSEVFTLDNQDSPELLKAVSMQIASANTHYEISVKIGGGNAQKVAEGTKNYSGYYTERLDTPLLIPAGETFEIIVRLECESEAPVIFATANIQGSTSSVPAVRGKAFLYEGKEKPLDLSSQAVYPCIRAFTCSADADGYRATTPAQASVPVTGGISNASGAEAGSLSEHVTITASDAPGQESVSGYGALAVNYSTAGQAEAPVVNLPDKFDLRKTLTLPPVRDQGSLNTCWAFASTACVENSLALRNMNVVDYPSSLSLSQSTRTVVLNTELKEQAVTLTADLKGSKNPPSSKIYWSATGDLDSIRMEHTESINGEEVQVFTALKPGTVTITAQSDADMSVRASCKVTITNQGIESLELTPKQLKMKTGEYRQLGVTTQPETAVDKTVLFESSQPDIAYVDQNGKVTALSEGTAVITAKAGTAEASCQVTVEKSEKGKGDFAKPSQGSGSATGDTSPIPLLVLFLLASAGIAAAIIRLKYRHRH